MVMQTEKAFPRGTFEREREFVVLKSFTISGQATVPRSVFDKTLVSTRKLRQLYDQRYLRLATKEEAPEPSPVMTEPVKSTRVRSKQKEMAS